MDLWRPPEDQPQLLAWWQPVIVAARLLREQRFAWPLHLDELTLVGRVDRRGRPAIWVYRHARSGGEVYLDETGQAYTFTKTPNARSFGRFSAIGLERAMWQADLPSVVEPTFYDPPPPVVEPSHQHRDPDREPAVASTPRRRGHLRVIEGGRGRPIAG